MPVLSKEGMQYLETVRGYVSKCSNLGHKGNNNLYVYCSVMQLFADSQHHLQAITSLQVMAYCKSRNVGSFFRLL